MKVQKLGSHIITLLEQCVTTKHSAIVSCGLFIGLCYLPVWLETLFAGGILGSDVLLVSLLVYLGFQQLWQQRSTIANLAALSEDRLLGHLMIISGILIFPFARFDTWPQALVWTVILVGVACSTWGLNFFKMFPLPSTLLVISTYSNLGFASRAIWRGLTPPNLLESFMAWSGSIGLRAIGQTVTAKEQFLSLPTGAVEVAFGCNGFEMAFTLAVTGLIIGLFFKQSWLKIAELVIVGILLALTLNIPRIMLLALAAVYWGKDSFEFWHGPIGGQIFSTILFTVYYYVLMGIINRKSQRGNI